MTRAGDAASIPQMPGVDESVRRDELRIRGRVTEVFRLGEGRPVVFLHGWGMTPHAYLPGLHALAAHGVQIIAPSLPGFGGSDSLPLRQQGVTGVAEHIISLLQSLGVDRPVQVVGHSFGGGVGLRMAASRPWLVHSATLFAPVGGAGEGAVPLRGLLGAAMNNMRGRCTPNALGSFYRSLRAHPSAVILSALAAWQSDQLTDVLRAEDASVPVRILFSHADRMVRPGAIPGHARRSVVVDMVDGSHSWLLGEPQRFAHEAMHLHRLATTAA